MNVLKVLLFLVLSFLLYEGFSIGLTILSWKDDFAVFVGSLVCLFSVWLWIYVAAYFVKPHLKEKTDEASDDSVFDDYEY